jgi:translocation and assembly module TamB
MERRRIVRRIMIGVPALLVCLFLIALVILNTNAFRNYLRSEIGTLALEHVGARVEVGSINTHWTHLAIDLNNTVVYGSPHPALNETPLLRADRLEVGLRFLPLLRGHAELRELILDRPIVHLRIDAQGRSNLPVPPHPSTGSGNGVNEVFDFEIGDCAINNGEIFYNDAEVPLEAELHDLTFNADYSRLTSNYKGSLSYDNGRLVASNYAPVSHAMQVNFTATRSGLRLENLHLATAASQLTLNAQLTNYASPIISANYDGNLSTAEVAHILKLDSLPIGNLALNGKLAYQSADRRPFIAAVNVQGQARSAKLQIRSTQQPIDVTSISANYGLNDATLQVTNLVADVLGGHARANWQMQHLDAAAATSRLEAAIQGVSLTAASNAFAPPNVKRLPFQGATDLALSGSWTGSITNAVGHARFAVSAPQGSTSAKSIPVNGLIQVDYNGPQNSIAFGQSHLQTANTKLAIAGTLSARRDGNSSLSVLATTSDLSETASLASTIQGAISPQKPPAQIPTVSGSASLTIRATGSARDPHMQAQLTAQNLAVDGSQWRSLTLTANANSSGITIQSGSLVAATGGANIAFSGKAELRNWSLLDRSLVELQLSMTNMPVATAEQVAQLHYPVAGTLSANISVSGTKAEPEGKATITLAKGTAWEQPINNLAVNAQSHGGTIHATANLQTPAGMVAADASYTLASQQYDVKLQGQNIKLEKISALEKHNLQGVAQLTASGSGTIHDPQLQMSLTIPQLQAQGQTVSKFEASVNVANQRANLDLQSVVYQGTVQAKGDVALTGDYNSDLTLDVHALPVAAVAANFMPSQGSKLGGQTEIHLTASGPLKTPAQMQAHLEIPTFDVTYGKAQLALAKPLTADYRVGTLTIAPTQIQGTGTNLTFGGTVPIKSNATYSLVADGTVDLNVVQQFEPEVKSSGQLELHIHSAGRPSGMQGQFQIKDAVFSTQSLPVGIEGLNAQINLSGTRADIANFSGTVGGGTVSAHGFATFGKQSDFAVAVNANSVRVRYPEGLRSIISGQVNLNGDTNSSSLTGRVLVDNISFTQAFDLANFADSFSGDNESGSSSALQNNMKLGIAIQSSQDINLANRQLSLGGSANLNIVGTLAQPVVLGRITLTSGDMFFLSKRFEVQSGTIEFSNPVRTEPVLNMHITTTIEQYAITLNLTGPVDRLRTGYTSDPALAPADIIHLLAFGNTNAEAASQPTQSATMGAESVLAQQAGSQVAGKLQNITGLSQINIDPLATNSSGDPGAQVAIQERITGSLLFTFSTNVTTTQGQTVTLQYDLNKRLSVTVLRDQNGGYGLDFRWHKVF